MRADQGRPFGDVDPLDMPVGIRDVGALQMRSRDGLRPRRSRPITHIIGAVADGVAAIIVRQHDNFGGSGNRSGFDGRPRRCAAGAVVVAAIIPADSVRVSVTGKGRVTPRRGTDENLEAFDVWKGGIQE